MTNRPKTIQIFLPDGSPRSIRIAEMTNRIEQAILVPRSKLKEADDHKEIKELGIYFLFGESDNRAKPIIYIGEAENCYDRLRNHNRHKEFWNTAIVIASKTSSFTRSHVKYLEWYCLSKAKEIDRYELDNSNTPAKPSISKYVEADLSENYEVIKLLVSTLGYPVFEEPLKRKSKDNLYCRGKDALAEGEYTEDGLFVFKGSTANLTETKTAGTSVISMREKLKNSGILKRKGKVYVFISNYLFSAPSSAAATVLGRQANGWTEWKDKNGKTLDELKRG